MAIILRRYRPILTLFFVLITVNAYATKISAPPPLPDEPLAEQHYFKEIYDNFHVLEITSTAPNGSRNGKKGQIIIYNNGGTFELHVNTDGSTTWQKIGP